jgi:aerobic carbon-monoxide dehydrogenase medium subunit
MIPASFDYHRPTSLTQAITLLKEYGSEAKILAGGQSLIPAMRFRLAQPGVLIDINRLAELDFLEERGDHLVIGALTRESALEENPLIERYPLLLDAAKVVADPLVRQRATVGGNLAHADPANDHPAVMLAYGATISASGPSGARTLGIDTFFTGLFESALKSGEILTEIRIPKARAGTGGAYIKVERKVGDYATAGVAVQLELQGTRCTQIRIALTNVNPVPMRAEAAEAALTGSSLDAVNLDKAGLLAGNACEPSGDLRGSVEYKRDLVRILVKRAVERAARRARGERV